MNILCAQYDDFNQIKIELQELRSQKNFDPNTSEHIDLLMKFGGNMVYINPDTLYTLSAQIKALSENANYSEGLVASEITLANAYAFGGDSKKAIEQSDKAIALGLQYGVHNLVTRGYAIKGMSWFKINNYAESFLSFQMALDYAKKNEDLKSISTILLNMATMFSLLNENEEALSIYQKALKIEAQNPNETLKAQILSNIAFLQVNTLDYKSAMRNVNLSIISFKKISKPAWLAFCYSIKGRIFLGRQNFDEALVNFNKSRIIHNSIQDKKGFADVLLGFSKAYYGQKKYSEARKQGLASLDLYSKVNLKGGVLDAYEILAKIEEELNSSSKALIYMKKAQTLSDSISNHDKSSKVSLMRAKVIFAEKQKQIEQANLVEIKNQQKNINIVLVALLGTLMLLFLIFKTNKKVKKINQQLAKQSQTLKKNKESLQEINTMKDKLFSIIGHDFRGPIAHLKQLLEMAAQNDLTPEELKFALKKLSYQTENIHFTLDNLLSWGKTQMSGFKVVSENVKIEDIIKQNVEFFGEQLLNKNLTVTTEFNENAIVWADKNHVDLIIRNLLSNSIKFSFENGEIRIRCTSNKNKLIIEIQDNGVGFSTEMLEQLLHKNQHQSTYGTLNEKGTGLGLIFCKEAIKVNMGKLWIESRPGIKTIIFFSLPLSISSLKLSENQQLEQNQFV